MLTGPREGAGAKSDIADMLVFVAKDGLFGGGTKG
jgi:hypothetical protein